ncbi:hypothetical protein J8281_14035 [Aquimarina sp. U1-2]|uniref:DUF6168 family protein n=1 Tax=Aquimarina sp. U1-2 TaxID=2823141 RepID=UPI001AED0ACD|nr:DUF6168 family protein [Aquimarina sp. U1-2]MBP2833310.1 hypothetical protein [Aquimarina sp. U1-2]
MRRQAIKFIVLFIIVVGLSYIAHYWIVDHLFLGGHIDMVQKSYGYNASFTFVLTLILIALSKRYKDQIGFIFLAGSFIKTGLFFAIFEMTTFKIDKNVFLNFFIPYLLCLILEVYYVSKILKAVK